MQTPAVRSLSAQALRMSRACAETLLGAGHRAWIVGGAVRDLALGLPPTDVDLASDATPDQVQALFRNTTAVGRAFGTVLIRLEGGELQHTSFRTEGGYSDARRPDQVRYGASLEQDAARRDFTCNALYLDPLTDEVADPEGGLADLRRGLLRCVGDPGERFREDGLRLLRMARFAARYDLEVQEPTLEGARANAAALGGVSHERTLGELRRMFDGPRPERALARLHSCGLLEVLFPGLDALQPASLGSGDAYELRRAAFEHLGGDSPELGLCRGLAILFDPPPRDPVAEPGDFGAARALLEGLRPPRALARCVAEHWRLGRAAEALLEGGAAPRAERVRLARDETWPSTSRLLHAWCTARRTDASALARFDAFAASLSEEERFPATLLTAADLEHAGVPRGPRWGRLLERAETAQLNGELGSEEQARAWLREQLARSS